MLWLYAVAGWLVGWLYAVAVCCGWLAGWLAGFAWLTGWLVGWWDPLMGSFFRLVRWMNREMEEEGG